MHCLFPAIRGHRNPVRALIFDMDGTILDTRAYHMDAWRQLVARHGLGPEHYEAAETGFGKTNWAIFDQWYGGRHNGHDYDALSDEKEEIFRELIKGRERARPGFVELLEWAKRARIKIALATSGPQANAEFLLDDLGVTRYFDTVLWGEAGMRSKPHPEPFLKVAWRLGLPPQQCVGFEDSVHGFRSVSQANMTLVAIAERPQELLKIRKWTPYVFKDFRGVRELIQRWGNRPATPAWD